MCNRKECSMDKVYNASLKIQELKIDNTIIKQEVLLGFINKKIKIDGIECLLNNEIMEG